LFPTLKNDSPGILALKAAKPISRDPLIRFATLFYISDFDSPKNLPFTKFRYFGDIKKFSLDELSNICESYRIPNQYRELSKLIALHYNTALEATQLNAQDLLDLFNQLDIFRREERFEQFLLVMQAIANAKQVPFNKKWLQQAAKVVKAIPVKPLLEQGYADAALAEQLKNLRLQKLNEWLKNNHM
jgi:tRNA nucleotidyltransferase (CCA-adding enzyme)